MTSSQNQFKQAYDEWWGEDGVCEEGKAAAAAEAVAQAIAKVWADAAVQVTCEGVGFACGWTASGGQAWAIGFAEALAQAAAEANDGAADGFCYADIRSVSVVIAEAAANAQAAACSTGGTAQDFQNSYAAAIEVGIATAFAEATAFACDAGRFSSVVGVAFFIFAGSARQVRSHHSSSYKLIFSFLVWVLYQGMILLPQVDAMEKPPRKHLVTNSQPMMLVLELAK